ncbi:MAG: dTDP-4-dehydrorhamnose reductase [Deltaproteobacteria bacterium]|jgi:dTDP-4-dehydrorhamnose reductase|nr:dTDP-4-dehydrorhamnose reductase [Deltaproteobacteria bacterium]
MPKALVLGGRNGLLGQALMEALKSAGTWEVAAPDPGRINYFSSSLHAELSALTDGLEPDCIFNAAAYTDVEGAEEHEDEAAAMNRALPACLARVVDSRPVRLIHFSTDFVFDGRKNTPYTTDDQPNPLSVYGRTKLAGEQAIQERAPAGYAIIRTAWMFGRGKKNFIQSILNICRAQGEARVVFDQIGSPTYAADLAQHAVTLAELEGSGIFHIVNSGQASWCDLAAEAVNCSQVECRVTPITSAERPSKAERPAYSVLDCSRFTNMTGRTPRAWPQALREYLMLENSGL